MGDKIFVLERETREVLVFSSKSAAETYIEPPDVNIYEPFDEEGNSFIIELDMLKRSWGEPVVKLCPTGKLEPERLKAYIVSFLGSLKEPLNSKATLSELETRLLEATGLTC
jgi:hypothetical protein